MGIPVPPSSAADERSTPSVKDSSELSNSEDWESPECCCRCWSALTLSCRRDKAASPSTQLLIISSGIGEAAVLGSHERDLYAGNSTHNLDRKLLASSCSYQLTVKAAAGIELLKL